MKNGKKILKFLSVLCFLQILLTVYLILKVYISNVIRPDSQEDKKSDSYYNAELEAPEVVAIDNLMKNDPGNAFGRDVLRVNDKQKRFYPFTVEIWANAAIGSYLWEHILMETKSVNERNPSIYLAKASTPNFNLVYKEGPGLWEQTDSTTNVSHVVLVLNGRTPEKVLESQKWLERVAYAKPPPKVALVLLGNENCDNAWLRKFTVPQGGPVRGVFLTYDDPSVNDKTIFQWPLGVATYRHFPLLSHSQLNISQPRKYLCNLFATQHPNSTRRKLFSLLRTSSLGRERCVTNQRNEWLSSETKGSSEKYVTALLSSDLTLCPAGLNTETYRVYEALTAGSVPVVEDSPSGGFCDKNAGWRLLKAFNSPVIWVKKWKDVLAILEKEAKMTQDEKVRRRKKLLNWYEWFKLRNKDKFLEFLNGFR